MAKPKPDGYHTATPGITVKGADRAIEFYKQAFGAQEIMRFPTPGGDAIIHAELRIGDSVIMLGDEIPGMGARSPQSLGGFTGPISLYVEDCDAVYARAVGAGATARTPVADMFWGDRSGRIVDPFGHEWSIMTHKEDVSLEEIDRRAQVLFAKMSAKGA